MCSFTFQKMGFFNFLADSDSAGQQLKYSEIRNKKLGTCGGNIFLMFQRICKKKRA